jgi:hypothetical protein
MRNALLALLMLAGPCAWAHVGSPNVYFEGQVGPYDIRVVIRPPGVVPGLAEINVRVLHGTAKYITVLPIFWDAGREGAPPPDVAERVRGETNLFHAALWLMTPGAYSVDVTVEGLQGSGTVIVPVNAVATTRNEMRPWFSAMLMALGALLFLGAVRLTGIAFGESLLEPGVELTKKLRWRTWLATCAGAIMFSLLLLFGKTWWEWEDLKYRSNRLYKPMPVSASISISESQPVMRLTIDESKARDWTPLIPDHGKLMHLFLVRDGTLDAFAHLHPAQQQPRIFDVAIPPFPAGNYTIYADVTHENGLSQTLTSSVQIPTLPEAFMRSGRPLGGGSDPFCSSTGFNSRTNRFIASDVDDSWHIGPVRTHTARSAQNLVTVSRLADGYTMIWERNGTLTENRDTVLHFRLVSPRGESVALQPFMGMFGHAAIRRNDGAVFTHLHPIGTFSMASQELFVERGNKALPPPNSSVQVEAINHHSRHAGSTNVITAISFPYGFPKPGPYRIWVQLKAQSKVFTGVFDANVGPEP